MKFALIGGFVALLAILLFQSLVVYLGWNLCMPALFKLPEITYSAAVGLTVLVRTLFGETISINNKD